MTVLTVGWCLKLIDVEVFCSYSHWCKAILI